MADTLLAALTETSVPDFSDYLLWEDNTGPTSGKISVGRLIGLLRRGVCEGRLTLTTAVPITTADVTGASTLYWSPIDAGYISLYDGTRWVGFKQAELSLALSGLTSGKAYDAFLDYNSGTPALVLGTAWTNATTRAVGLTTQDGIAVLSGATTKRHVGTIYTTATTTTEDSKAKRFVSNRYNRVPRPLRRVDATASWTYSSATFQQANAAAANQVEVVACETGIELDLTVYGMGDNNAAQMSLVVAIGEDALTPHADVVYVRSANNAGSITLANVSLARLDKAVPLGYHAYLWLEACTGASPTTIYGTSGASPVGFINGMLGKVLG